MTSDRARRFVDKVVFITGAGRGQGRAEAVRFAEEGAAVIAIDVPRPLTSLTYEVATSEDLAETVRLVEAAGGRIHAGEVDTRDYEALSDLLKAGVATFGRLDAVVANAGICSGAMSWEITAEQWKETIDVNLTGTFNTARAAIPIMIEQGTGGSIVFTSSVAGLRGLPFLGSYVASKHGITGLAKTMSVELGEHRIRVNTVHPSGVATGMMPTEMFELIQKHAATLAPIFMGSLPDGISQPEDIAEAVVWLSSDQARHITGVQLPIDLGTLAR